MDTLSSSIPVKLSRRSEDVPELVISYLMQQAVENPDVISLAAGLVDSRTLPVQETRQAVEELLGNDELARRALQYGTTAGSEWLRGLLLEHFAHLEETTTSALGISPQQLVITTGSQQLLSLICEILLDPGDICLVAGPTYFVFCGNLSGVHAEAVTIPVDDQGMQTDLLEQSLKTLEAQGELNRVKLIYVVSYYDNPAGLCLSAERRADIVSLAHQFSRNHRIFVLEDAAYRELRYDGPVLPSLWSFDESRESVIYTQTFSKTFSPGLRVGYGLLPPSLVKPVHDRKGNEDFGSANFNQHLLATVIEQGLYRSHVEQVRSAYRTKRDAMLSAAQEFFSDIGGVEWVHPHGGLYVWMSLPERISTGFSSELFRKAVEKGVMYVPGELCYAGPVESRPRHQMRLSYGVETVEEIRQGMKRLSEAVRFVTGAAALSK